MWPSVMAGGIVLVMRSLSDMHHQLAFTSITTFSRYHLSLYFLDRLSSTHYIPGPIAISTEQPAHSANTKTR